LQRSLDEQRRQAEIHFNTKMKETCDHYETKMEGMHTQMANMNTEIEELRKLLAQRDLTVNEQASEITSHRATIKDLNDQIEQLRAMNNEGDAGIAELKRMLAESEQKLKQALSKITDLEGVISADVKEKARLNKEIERLNNILKATNENLSEMERKSSDKIRQL